MNQTSLFFDPSHKKTCKEIFKPPRVLRRLQHLRRWSHEKVNEAFPLSTRACSAFGEEQMVFANAGYQGADKREDATGVVWYVISSNEIGLVMRRACGGFADPPLQRPEGGSVETIRTERKGVK